MLIRQTAGDFGTVYPVTLYPTDGKRFSVQELAGASFSVNVYRKDRLKLPVESSDLRVYPRDVSHLYLFQPNDQLFIGEETFWVSWVDLETESLVIVNRLLYVDHKQGSVIRHLTFSSSTALVYDAQTGKLVLTVEAGMFDHAGIYYLEVEVSTPSRQASVTLSDPSSPFRAIVLRDLN